MDFVFTNLEINRLEIKCATENYKSQSIPENLGFVKERIIKEGEFLADKFVDLFSTHSLKKSTINLPEFLISRTISRNFV